MLVAVRAEVESVEHWREQFKTHEELFKSQGVSIVHMGSADENKVMAVFETSDIGEFTRIFNDPSTTEAMANDRIIGGVEMYVLDDTYTPQS